MSAFVFLLPGNRLDRGTVSPGQTTAYKLATWGSPDETQAYRLFNGHGARDKGPNRETDSKQGAEGCSWRCASLPRGHANIPPSPVRWRYVCVCSPTSQVASSEAYPFPQVKPLLINWLFGRLRLIRRRIDFGHADARQLGDGKSATRELLEDCRLKRRRIGSLPRGCK